MLGEPGRPQGDHHTRGPGKAAMSTGGFLEEALDFIQRTRAQANHAWPFHGAGGFFTITVEIYMHQFIQTEHCCAIWECNSKGHSQHEVYLSSYANMKRQEYSGEQGRRIYMFFYIHALCSKKKKAVQQNLT